MARYAVRFRLNDPPETVLRPHYSWMPNDISARWLGVLSQHTRMFTSAAEALAAFRKEWGEFAGYMNRAEVVELSAEQEAEIAAAIMCAGAP